MKCKIVNGKKICRETNPFKMWGSWVGAGIPLLFGFLFLLTHSTPFLYVILPFFIIISPIANLLGCTGAFECSNSFGLIATLILPIMLCFLLGWGIHSLIRRFRK